MIELRLAETPTTGYRWHIAADGAPSCAVVADAFEPPAAAPGSAGRHIWRIEAVHTGQCHFELRYERSFQAGAAPARIFTLDVRVTD